MDIRKRRTMGPSERGEKNRGRAVVPGPDTNVTIISADHAAHEDSKQRRREKKQI